MKVVIAAAGTGGHINPGIAIANKIMEKEPDSKIIFIGTPRGLENDLVPRAGYELKTIDAYGINRKINLDDVWWRDKGLKINKEAITYSEITGISGDTVIVPKVTIKKSSYTQDVFAKIVREAGDFAIITNYEDKELLNLGVPEELIAGRQTLKMYDEAVLVRNEM